MAVAAGHREQAVWALFSDWCLAREHQPLPSAPLTLAQFLSENPAAVATQRRRVGVINAVHRRRGHHPPGRTETVREQIDARRRQRRNQHTATVIDALARLPEHGWPTALFASRDALMLALSTTGMSAAAIAALRVGDILVDDEADAFIVTAGTERLTTSALLPAAGISPARIARNWLRIRAIQHFLPSTTRLAAHLRGDRVPATGNAPDELMLLVPLDRWGATPLQPVPLSAAAISGTINAHLAGTARPHAPIPARKPADPAPVVHQQPDVAPRLDPTSFTRGIAARRRAAEHLETVNDTLDGVESRADQLLSDLLALLDDTASDPTAARRPLPGDTKQRAR